ncbi:uncharacterized protein LOC129917777 isoform X2 [Episyrphus balteatus]|uniref:uncharacterized protein LOC129917777 isoform X2 n=1 Tax=Episyrphus balteatus TaxID=286459 RepID=UPI002486AC5E|nr:uncharacterized protein LOC129917777 isoform X2 [Episyrphus balteatus]
MDLADQIDDYICSFEGIGDLSMDSLAMFIFIWAVLALFLVWLCKFLYNKYMNKETPIVNSRNNSVVTTGAKANGDKLRLSEPKEILSSKDVKDSKPLSAGAGGGRGRSGIVGGPNAPLRKRVVRQSSTGPETRKKRIVPPPANVVGPETTSVTWTSQVFRWLYSDLVIVNELLISWVIALNDSLKKSVEDHGVAVEIVRVLPDSPPPGLSNIFCNCDENNPADMVTTFDVDAMPVLQVKTFRQKSGKVDTSHYKVTVSRFRARMTSNMNYNALKGDMRVEGYPDIRIAMNSVGAIKAIDQDEQQLQDVISEILTTALRETVYPCDFSIYSTCPRAEIEVPEIPVILPVHYDSLAHNMENYNTSGYQNQMGNSMQAMASGRRLLVKIVKGEGLADAKDPYVVVEMDEPAQKNQTGARQGTNPYWDEHFLFELSPQSAEILFEVYDRPTNTNDPPKFLGLGLVGIDELAVGPASSQTLALQPRPYETQKVAGAIMVDFVFIEGAEIPIGPRPYKLKEALKISTPMINEHIRNGADLADAAVRALQDGALTNNGNPSKSTLIIHSVQRNNNNPNAFKVEINKEGQIEVKESPSPTTSEINNTDENQIVQNDETNSEQTQISTPTGLDENQSTTQDISVTTDITASPTDSYPPNEPAFGIDETGNGRDLNGSIDEFGRPVAASSPNQMSRQINGNGSYNNGYNSLPRSQTHPTTPIPDDLDERSRSKKRNFFGTLKKRLGRSKTRTRSADRDGMIPFDANNLNGDSRSLSVDRGVLSKSNSLGPKINVTTLDHSRRSSISESSAISGFSSASNKTYVHEASTLVLETIENGVKRHFIVPLAIAQRPKWRRKGTKLHIYNDHTFVAKHLSGSRLVCAICTKSIPRRPGKQGYECRDCQMICHKQCHVRAPQACTNPTVLSMELSTLPVLSEKDLIQ